VWTAEVGTASVSWTSSSTTAACAAEPAAMPCDPAGRATISGYVVPVSLVVGGPTRATVPSNVPVVPLTETIDSSPTFTSAASVLVSEPVTW
jgi:hypothetical protein